ncbi:MAG: hypothetical protein J6R20_05405 [Clostridia bacterium]|nr:hypothetical protein [Clostridia bacterium]
MKKSIRILSILMAFAMLIGTFSVMGSAYQAYKNDAIEKYNDVDAPVFTLEQYASMALDEVDRMLAKEQLSVNIYIGVLNLGSITEAVASVESLLSSVSTLLPLLGDAQMLKITPLEGDARGTTDDLEIIYDVFDFLSINAPVFQKYVSGDLSLGIMTSFIDSFLFDVRELAIGLIYSLTPAGEAAEYDYFDTGADGIPAEYLPDGALADKAIITLGQQLLNSLVLGEWVLLNPYFEDVTDHVDYEDYLFDGAMDLANNDYYGWVHPKQWVTYALGDSKVVAKGAAAPAPQYALVDITGDRTGYESIEDLMRRAYNEILIPVLIRDTVQWMRELCGVVYLPEFKNKTVYDEATQTWVPNPTYNPNYKGEPLTDETRTIFADIFNMDFVPEKVYDIPANDTFVDHFNDILGEFLDGLLIAERGVPNADGFTWNWVDGSNKYLLTNVASVAKFVLQITGDEFFPEYFTVPSASELEGYSDQQVVALVMRGILNGSVDYIYIGEEHQSIVDVGYAAVEQLAWQDIPQFTYVKPVRADFANDEAYYDAVVQKMLDILLDIAVYNLNSSLDMVPAEGNNPAEGEGLIPYQGNDGSYETTFIQIAAWAITTYGPILALEFNSDDANGKTTGITMDEVWADLDTVLDAIIPLKGDDAWINTEISNSGLVAKSFIFDYILKPIYTLNAENLAKIFAKNTSDESPFNTKNGVAIIMDLLDGIFDLLFPNVFSDKATTVDALVQNDTLAGMIHDLFKSLGRGSFIGVANGVTIDGRAEDIVAVGLPLVCMLLGLSDEQEFSEMENFLPETIAAGTNPTFRVYNGSSGVNTGFTDAYGNFTQDQLYKYTIGSVVIRSYVNGVDTKAASVSGIKMGDTLDGGESVDVTLQGNLVDGMLIEMNIEYFIKGENGENITSTALTKTTYAVVGETDKDDDAIEIEEAVGNRKVLYESEIYLDGGDDLNDVDGYQIRIKDSGENKSVEDPATTGTVNVTSVTGVPFVAVNPEAQEAQNFKGQEGLYFLAPFTAVEGFERFELTYEVDEETGELVLDEEGNPIPDGGNNGGVEDGKYTVTTNVNVNGTNKAVVTNIHLYNDFGLESLFAHEAAANRQQNDYDMKMNFGAATDLWADYIAALKDAAVLSLTPKKGSNFEAKIYACDDEYENLYEQYKVALEDALEALAPYEKSAGVGALQAAVKDISGDNAIISYDAEGRPYRTDLEYWEEGYVFFGMRDYAPHSYLRYRDARSDALGLVDSQIFYVPAPFEADYEPTEEEQAAYDEAIAQYEEKVANRGVVGAIEATYAQHKLELMADRLIKLTGNKDKLRVVYDMTVTNGGVNAGGASYYTAESWEAYDHAKTFAANTLAMSDSAVEPSRINTATTELIYAWKRLVKSCDFTNLDAAINAAADAGALGLGNDVYTAETYEPFFALYTEAVNFDRGVADTEENQAEIVALANALLAAFGALDEIPDVVIEEPEFPVIDPDKARDTWLYHDSQYTMSFAPSVDYESKYMYAGIYMSDETEVDGYIVGLGQAMDPMALEMIFDPETLVNTTVEIRPNPYSDLYGTGAEIWLFNATTGEKIAAYQTIIRGDVTGDGSVDGGDSAEIGFEAQFITDWRYNSYGDNCSYYCFAADMTQDFAIDMGDADAIELLLAGQQDVNQETGEPIYYY